MFSNGTEYDEFMGRNCEKCPHYVDYGEATEESPVCSIEEVIILNSVSDVAFPYEHLIENDSMARYDCKKRLGAEWDED